METNPANLVTSQLRSLG